jgi:hypothetical protein
MTAEEERPCSAARSCTSLTSAASGRGKGGVTVFGTLERAGRVGTVAVPDGKWEVLIAI